MAAKEPTNPALELLRNTVSGQNLFISFLSSKTAAISLNGLISLTKNLSSTKGILMFLRAWANSLLPEPTATLNSYFDLSRRETRLYINL